MWLARPNKRRIGVDIQNPRRFQVFMNDGRSGAAPLILSSATAAIDVDTDGRKIELWSQSGYPQRLLFANIESDVIIGSIEIQATGAVIIKNGTNGATVRSNWPVLWHSQVVGVIGITAPVALQIRDYLGNRVDEVTWNRNYQYWFIPDRFRVPSRAYDVEEAIGSDTNSEASGEQTNRRPPMATNVLTVANRLMNQRASEERKRPSASGFSTPRTGGSSIQGNDALGTSQEKPANMNKASDQANTSVIERSVVNSTDIIWLDHLTEKPEWAHETVAGRIFVHRNRECTCTGGAW